MRYLIYVDGSAQNNKKNIDNIGGFGYVVLDNQNNIIDAYSKIVNNTTNNEMELSALHQAILDYGTSDLWSAPDIFLDSQYTLKSVTIWHRKWINNGWKTAENKPVENKELINNIINLLADGKHFANLYYCKGHSGIYGNEIADRLATGKLSPQEVLNDHFVL